MSMRFLAGVISAFYNPFKVPDAPTIGTATGANASASVAFTAPTNVGGSAITTYGVQSTPGQLQATGATSPITVTGLTNGTPYTFNVWALNSFGPSPFSAASGSVTPLDTSNRALFFGGRVGGSDVNVIQYVNISSGSNTSDFGDLSIVTGRNAACASSTRAVQKMGSASSNVMEYVTFSTLGNATDFGDVIQVGEGSMGCGNATRGLFINGDVVGAKNNVIQYITIATTGNATDFGDSIYASPYGGAFASTTRAISGGGSPTLNAGLNVIQYITIATTGNATDFGDLTYTGFEKTTGFSNSTRGLFAGGDNNSIAYVTIATLGNAIDFGDLSATGQYNSLASASNSTKGLIAGGQVAGIPTNVICFVTIGTTGNAADFGDLLSANQDLCGTSNAHGGL